MPETREPAVGPDPNDTVAHQDRRVLRGLAVYASWVNHHDTSQINTMDALVTEDGRQYLKHHLIDFGSILGSQVRSRAGMVGIDTKTVGVFTRFERMLILMGGILFNKLTLVLWLLAVLNNFSALQRVIHTVQASRSNPQKEAKIASRGQL